MDTTISGSIYVYNDKEAKMLLVVDGHSGDQTSQLIFLLDLILISVITIIQEQHYINIIGVSETLVVLIIYWYIKIIRYKCTDYKSYLQLI